MTSGTGDLDLIVAGAGPAGLATAITAALAGLRVVVVEPREGPIDKACGEGLMPGAVAALAALGVRPEGRAFHGIRYLDGAHVAEARFPDGPGLGVRRTTLQAALRARADDLGVGFETGRVTDVRQPGGGVEVDGRRARYLVAADGLHSPVRGLLGLEGRARGRARYGIRRHYRCTTWTDLVEVHWARDHEVYVTPVADDLVGVAVLGPRGSSVDSALEASPLLRERLAGATPVGTDRGAGPLRQVARARSAGRVLLVGDAAGYVDALTGEGVKLAVEEAGAAVEAVLADRPQDYDAAWRTITADYRHGTELLLRASGRPVLRRRLVPAAERFPRVFGRAVTAIGGRPAWISRTTERAVPTDR